MIWRIWHGRVPPEKANPYLDFMRQVALPDDRSTPGRSGNDARSAFVLTGAW